MNVDELGAVIAQTPAGEPLPVDGITDEELQAFTESIAGQPTAESGGYLGDTGPAAALAVDGMQDEDVQVSVYWWGAKIRLSHLCVQTKRELLTATNLTAIGVPAFVAEIIAKVIGLIAGNDRGNGLTVSVTWLGVHWYYPNR